MVSESSNSFYSPKTLTITAIFTALVCVATMLISTYIPATEGFFNIGESMIYLAAILFGPIIGGFAGGVGAMIADLLLGYAIFAPATLIAKGCEGVIVGSLVKRKPKFMSSESGKYVTLVLGIAVGAYIWWVGTNYYSGELFLTSSLGEKIILGEFTFNVPSVFWAAVGLLVAAILTAIGYYTDPEFGWTIISVLMGGFVMVSGYYIYEQFFMGVAAIVEVPVNIGQMTIGAAIALPLSKMVKNRMPEFFK